MTQADFETIIADTSKRIESRIQWSGDEDHFPALEFRVDVSSDSGYPLIMKGSYNPLAQTLSYVLIHRLAGRIYALDLGKDHHNPTCETVGEKHKHRWGEGLRDKVAYVPEDITATVENPVDVWDQFCREAGIHHNGLDVPEHQIPPGIF